MENIIGRIAVGFFRRLKLKTSKARFPGINLYQQKLLKHLDDKSIKNIKINNHIIWYRRPYEVLYTYQALFREELYRFSTSSETPLIIDCGSNIGISILYFKQLFPKAIIYAYEADKENYSLLVRNINDNGLKDVHLNHCAVWVEKGFVSFNSSSSEASHISELPSAKESLVPSVKLSDILDQHKAIDFLKIDIEGAEWNVIQECAAQLGKVKNIFIEYHGKVEETGKLVEILKSVEEQGFKIYINHATDSLKQPFYRKSSGLFYDIQLHLFCFK